MESKKNSQESVADQMRQKAEDERQSLIAQIVKLPNGATFTRLKPVGSH